MKILVINAGSSSLKYQLFDMETKDVLAKGLCERIGDGGTVTHKKGADKYYEETELTDHSVALSRVLELLCSKEHGVIGSVEEIDAVGHRVAHGGEQLKKSSKIDTLPNRFISSAISLALL